MRTWTVSAALLAAILTCCGSHHRAAERGRYGAQAGAFDYYLLVLSWSPEYCYAHGGAPECRSHSGFIVHGLWPQNRDGTYPLNCRTDRKPPSAPGSMAGIMPEEIVDHEWRQHGTCSGLSGDEYLALIRQLHDRLRIPPRLEAPSSSFAIRPAELKRAFEEANPNLSSPDLAIQLRGRYLSAVEVCLAKDQALSPVNCSGIRDASGGTFLVAPVR